MGWCKLKRFNTITQNFKHNIKLTGITRVYFVKSEWENLEDTDTLSWSYLLYRVLFWTYFIVCLSHSIYRDKTRQYWILMATHWSLIIQTIYATIFLANLSYRYYQHYRDIQAQKKHNFDSGPLSIDRSGTLLNVWDSITWFLLNLTGTFPYVVTLGYWGFVYTAETDHSRDLGDTMLNLTVHGFNAVLALADIFIIAIPIRMAHAVYTLSGTLLYLIFAAVYEYSGGSYKNEEKPYIYSFLNWREESEWTVFRSFVALIGAFIVHVLMWSFYRLRLFLVAKYPCQSCYSLRA